MRSWYPTGAVIRNNWLLERKSQLCSNQPPPPAPIGATKDDPEGLLEADARARRMAAREIVAMFGKAERDLYRQNRAAVLAACTGTLELYERGFLKRSIQTRFQTPYEQRAAFKNLRELQSRAPASVAYLP